MISKMNDKNMAKQNGIIIIISFNPELLVRQYNDMKYIRIYLKSILLNLKLSTNSLNLKSCPFFLNEVFKNTDIKLPKTTDANKQIIIFCIFHHSHSSYNND